MEMFENRERILQGSGNNPYFLGQVQLVIIEQVEVQRHPFGSRCSFLQSVSKI